MSRNEEIIAAAFKRFVHDSGKILEKLETWLTLQSAGKLTAEAAQVASEVLSMGDPTQPFLAAVRQSREDALHPSAFAYMQEAGACSGLLSYLCSRANNEFGLPVSPFVRGGFNSDNVRAVRRLRTCLSRLTVGHMCVRASEAFEGRLDSVC